VVLEEDGEDQLDRPREKLSIAKRHGGKERPTYNKTKEGYLDWSHLAYDLPYKTRFSRKGKGVGTLGIRC
jgi:hypothetical protein